MSKRLTLKAMAAGLLSISLTACAADGTQMASAPASSLNSSPDNDSDSAADKEQEPIDNSDTEQINPAAYDHQRMQRIQKYETENPVTVFEAALRNGSSEYDCTAYIHHLMSETDDTYRGDCAVEISDNGEVVDRTMLPVGYTLGQKGTEFSKSGDDGYFSVIELESGSVLLSTREEDGLTQATLYTVNDDEIAPIERYFANPADKPEKGSGMRSFNLSRNYTTYNDSIIFDINGDAVTVAIDFDELTLKCDENYESIVYCE